MKKIKYYLDTTVFNFKFTDDDPSKRKSTEKFFHDLPEIAEDTFISDVVLREIEEAEEPKKSLLKDLVRDTNPVLLEVTSEVVSLAERYIAEGIIPENYRDDALHIAVAVVNEIDAIISWNLEHIVKLKTRREVNGINKLLGYHEIEICTPEEVIEI